MESPEGDPNSQEDRDANAVVDILISRCLRLIAIGAHVLVENPALSYMCLMPKMLLLIGFPGLYLVRIDHCTCGMPYKKPQFWLTTNPELMKEGEVCFHPTKHPETLVGSGKTRVSAPYPKVLAERITHAWGRCFTGDRKIRKDTKDAARAMFRDLYGDLANEEKTEADKLLREEVSRVGQVMVLRGRRGAEAVSSDTTREEDTSNKLDI